MHSQHEAEQRDGLERLAAVSENLALVDREACRGVRSDRDLAGGRARGTLEREVDEVLDSFAQRGCAEHQLHACTASIARRRGVERRVGVRGY